MLTTIFSGPDDLIVLVVAIVLLFGGAQLPKLARNAGDAMREFRKAGAEANLAQHTLSEPAAPPSPPVPATPALDGSAPGSPDERVTLSRAELDALLAAREAAAAEATGKTP